MAELLQDQRIKAEIIQEQTQQIHLLKSLGVAKLPVPQRKQLVRDERHALAVQKACQVIALPRSTYYYRQQRSEAKQQEDQKIITRLEQLAREFSRYGVRRMTAQLQHEGFVVNRKRVYRLMQEQKLLCKVKKRFVVTTNSKHPFERYPNLYAGNILPALNQVWIADITHIRLRKGNAYLAVILDAFSRRAIGWHLSRTPDASLSPLRSKWPSPLGNRKQGVIHHSDQGVQYACHAYTGLLKQHGFRISMSRKANPYDNAQAESFMATLKKEEVYLSDYRTYEGAAARLPRFIDDVYNRKRLHSSLGYLSPVAFEIKQNQPQQPAKTHLSLHS
ncbi:MAG: IS3 family transposase [bacterium]|nr:IS3 family transposase [bacterium]